MKRILCYGDSNTWGYDPEDVDSRGVIGRFPEDVRWTGRLQAILGPGYRILEEGLGGRTTVFEDPTSYGRNGHPFLEVVLRSCDPVDLVILMLGTNDLKEQFSASSHVITNGMARLLRTVEATRPQLRNPDCKVLVAAPVIPVADGNGAYQYDFSPRSTETGEELRVTYRYLAAQTGYEFIDVNDYVSAAAVDGVHLDAQGHETLAKAMAEKIKAILEE